MTFRISTNSMFTNETANMLQAQSQLQIESNDLSSGISLHLPSDNPLVVGQVMQLSSDLSTQNSNAQNAQLASNQLTSVDGALSNLTDLLQSARTLAVQGADGTLSSSDRSQIATQIGQLFNEAVSIANTQYNGSYIFAGTAVTQNGPVNAVGDPPTGVSITGNNAIVSENFGNGNSIPLSTSLQQAFNVNSADGSNDIFTTLLNLQNALTGSSVTGQSLNSIEAIGSVITPTTTLSSAGFNTPLTADSNGKYAITISGQSGSSTLTFANTDSLSSIISAINSAGVGVSASYDQKTGKISLTSSSSFTIADAPSAGATNTGNLVEVLGLPNTVNIQSNVSGSIGDIDNVLNVALAARGTLGASIQSLSNVQTQDSASATNETASISSMVDTNVAQVSTQFALQNTALQAAYMTTSRLEGHMLFDYLPAS